MRVHGLLLAGAAVVLSGCVSIDDPAMFASSSQGFAPSAPNLTGDTAAGQSSDDFFLNETETAAAGVPVPQPSPNSADATSPAPVTELASVQPLVQANTAVDALNRGITQSQPAQPSANLYSAPAPSAPAVEATASVATGAAAHPAELTAAPAQVQPEQIETPAMQELAVVEPPQKKSIFARLFAPQSKAPEKPRSKTSRRVSPSEQPKVVLASVGGSSSSGLPGVNLSSVFGVGSNNASDVSRSDNVQLASAAGLARLAPNGLRLQTEKVNVDCFKPELISVLRSVERHYDRPVVVTSGFRSPKYNRRVGGASGSRHTSCEAADIQVEGVSKWQLAKYLRAMPGRGGVGTYCYTESVHIDTGNTRDWNWRCRRRKK